MRRAGLVVSVRCGSRSLREEKPELESGSWGLEV